MSQNDASAKYAEDTVEQLQYARYGGYYMAGQSFVPVAVKLVYARVNPGTPSPSAIDAVSGGWLSAISAAQPAAEVPRDAIGHWAQADLAVLRQYGIISPNEAGDLRPDADLAVGDWMNLVMKAANPNFVPQPAIAAAKRCRR